MPSIRTGTPGTPRPSASSTGTPLFSGNQLHSTVPNHSGRTRFSIDFRTVHVDDVVARREAPNVDSECTGTTLRDFLPGTDLQRIDEEVALACEGKATAGARPS